MRTLRSRASPVTCFNSATAPIASCASRPAGYASRTPRVSRPPCPSGLVRRRRAVPNCRWRSRGCGPRSMPRCRWSTPAHIEACIAQTVGRGTACRPVHRVSWWNTWPPPRRYSGLLPTQQRLVFERFFDEAGDMHLVVHSPFGARINRAFGLVLRKRFCRAFNFELQAAATEDAIVLSLGETHSFALERVAAFPQQPQAEPVLIQALLDAPLVRDALALGGNHIPGDTAHALGKKTPAPLQRMAAEDLISVVFPDQLACAENLSGEREIPGPSAGAPGAARLPARGHGSRWPGKDLLARHGARGIQMVTRDLPHPSPLAQEILDGASLRLSGRCAARGAAYAGGGVAPLAGSGDGRSSSAGWTRPRSRRCAKKPGPTLRMPMNCTTR